MAIWLRGKLEVAVLIAETQRSKIVHNWLILFYFIDLWKLMIEKEELWSENVKRNKNRIEKNPTFK